MTHRLRRGSRFPVMALIVSLVLALATPSKAEDDSARFPTWSWDSVPVYLHFGSATQLTDEQVQTAARLSNFICLEKAHGRLTDRARPERIMALDARRIREANPEAKVLLYWNTLIAWPFTSYNQRFAETHPRNWTLRDRESGEPLLKSTLGDTPVYQYNLLNPDVRAWWARTAGGAVREFGFDGLYMDAISQARRPLLLDKGWGRDQGESLDQAAVEMMKQVRMAMGPERLLVFNGFRTRQGSVDNETKGGMEFLPHADGAKIEHFDQFASATKEDIVLSWRMAAEAAAAGKLVLIKAWPDHEANFTNKAFMQKSPAEQEAFARGKLTFPLACFLIGARRHAYFCYGWGYDVEDGQLVEYPEYRRRLGPPQGEAARVGQSWVFTRDFEHASVRVDLESRTATIAWNAGDVPPALPPPALPVGADDPRPKPNIVFIFADDWGWGDLSCHGSTWLETPNLDRLASEGIDFAQFNVLNPVCSPSRAAVMTGHYPARYCIHQHFASPGQNRERGMPDWLDPQAPSLPRLLRQAGYRTGHFGKWHLTNRETHGAPPPEAYGYDEAKVFNGGAEWPSAPLHAAADDAVAFIKAHADRPFFVNVWLHESHTPHVPTPESVERWKHLDEQRRIYAAVITDGDNAVGRILAALRETGVEGNTLVMFSSDNGPESPSQRKRPAVRDEHTSAAGYDTWCSVGETGGLRGRKRSLFEGGVRVPFLVRWPGHAPAGSKNDATVLTAVDLLPTLCAAAGIEPPADYRGDGENLLAAFNGKPVVRTRPVFWQWKGVDREPDWWPRLAVREGDWKLVIAEEPRRAELYRLSDDRGEARDLAAEQPGIVARLSALVTEWADTLPASPAEACIGRRDRADAPTRDH